MKPLAKVRFAKRKFLLSVKPGARILDVGSGSFPSLRSTVACDLRIENWDRSENIIVDRPFVWANAEHLPFKDNSFDFVVLSHVLEHSFFPERLLEEIQRLAPRGHIETPCAWMELVHPLEMHCSRVSILKEELVVTMKQAPNETAFAVFPEVQDELERVYQYLLEHRPEMVYTMYHWERPIRYKVFRPEDFTGWERVITSPEQREFAKHPGLAYRLLTRCVQSLFRPRSRFNLLALVACPVCRGPLTQTHSSMLTCHSCGKTYGQELGHWDLRVQEGMLYKERVCPCEMD